MRFFKNYIITITIVFSFNNKPFNVDDNAILHITLDDPISEKSYVDFQPDPNSFLTKSFGLKELKMGLKEAATDKKVKGILINVDIVQAGIASIEEIRNSILEF